MQEKADKSSKRHPTSSEQNAGLGTPAGEDSAAENETDALSDDELAVFRKIMGEIEGQEDGDDKPADNADLNAEEQERLQSILESTEDVKEGANTAGDADDDDDDLDADQQKAFESIMAQIEGGAEEEPPAEPVKAESDPAEEADDETDFAAELEKVAKLADSGASEDAADAGDADDDDDDLNEDQQKAFESILAQIESGDDGDGSGEANIDKAKTDLSAEAEEQAPIAKDVLSADAEAEPSSNDAHQAVNAKLTDETKKTGITTPSKREPKAAPAKKDDVPQPDKETLMADDSTVIGKSGITPKKKKWLLSVAVICAFLGVGIGGIFIWRGQRSDHHDAQPPVAQQPMATASTSTEPALPAVAPPEPERPENTEATDVARLKQVAGALDRLRGKLVAKQGEIDELRAYYQSGIDAEMKRILDTVRKSGNSTISFKAAMADAHISLGLSAIQRRNTYIRRLKTPLKALDRDSEELLYLSRKANIFAIMADKSSDIDVEGFVKHATDVMDAHRRRLSQLNIDAVDVIPISLKSLWQEIAQRLPVKPATSAPSASAPQVDNSAIWKAICAGDYSRKDHLTALSAEAARCLSAWKGKDLFLNGLNDLDPEAARALINWKGDWLGLNGLTELTPEVASYLARWKGKTLSLNGLSRLSPQVVAILSEWSGEQIELINVKHSLDWDNPRIRIFFRKNCNASKKRWRNRS
ncbi:hypothetical protein [Desulfosarcina cetonica]|uniref:hypothetical protein n=1 Tax=Desulfosarcina cetonica TaxID=90730 RepID=UPI0006D181E8|nr:hypothetical protein [Desulfosarcina cetonica]